MKSAESKWLISNFMVACAMTHMTLDHHIYFRNGLWGSELYGKVVLYYFL